MAAILSAEIRASIAATVKAHGQSSTPSDRGTGVVGSVSWSAFEQATLDRVLAALDADDSTDPSLVARYAACSAALPGKSIREVAARVRYLRDQEPETLGLAAAATGTMAASVGLPVPGATSADAQGSAASWRDPVSMLVGHSSIRATMLPTDTTDGSVLGTAPPPSFPFELQVSQLLQENLTCVDAMKANLLSAMLKDNVSLMAAFRSNTASVLSLLSALPVALPPLPASARLNDSFLPPQPTADADGLAPGAAGSSLGVEAGVVFARHPSALLGPRTAKRARSDTAQSSASDLMRPPSLKLAAHGAGLSLPPGASPPNALHALPLGQPSAPIL